MKKNMSNVLLLSLTLVLSGTQSAAAEFESADEFESYRVSHVSSSELSSEDRITDEVCRADNLKVYTVPKEPRSGFRSYDQSPSDSQYIKYQN